MTHAAARAQTLTGILLMVAAVSLFPASDAMSKYLTADYPALQILWLRHIVQLAMVLAMLAAGRRWSLMRTRQPGLQLLRGALTVAATLLFIMALKFVPLVDAVTILFAQSLIMVALSVPILGERVGIHRWGAVIVGFAGILIVMRPGLGVVHWAASLALICALCNALYQIVTRRLAETDSAITTFFYVSAIGVVALAPTMPFVWVEVTEEGWLWILGAGLFGGMGHYLMIRAFDFAGASVLAPFNYAQIGAATLLGYLWFGDLPDRWTILGLVIVIGSGLYILERERRAGARAPIGV
jgi:drug/metabolite transporter (DMT)-like permease